MNILIVDNNLYIKAYPQGLMLRAHLGLPGITATVRKPFALEDRDANADRVILSGSTAYIREEREWMVRERRFIDRWMERGVPILGICFGAQLIARHLFGEEAITALPFPISGSIRVRYKDGTPLFAGLPNPFGVVTTHYEGFVVPEAHRIAETEEWDSYAFAYPGSVYGVQFHPELEGGVGRRVVKLQGLLYDRHVYQEFEVKTRARHGMRLLSNFIRG